MREMNSDAIYIALGANLPSGDLTPRQTLAAALAALADDREIAVAARSSDWSSPAWPDPADPAYVNAVAQLETALSPRALLDRLHAVEAAFGRKRTVRNAPRPLDLDLVDFRGCVDADAQGLEIPHPRARERAFVLLPLAEIAPDWTHPQSGEGIAALIAALSKTDRDATYKLQPVDPHTSASLAFAGREG
jgi:2-amino-4-hydroxy-6-hydroxymethyldihydropteridine diphosphokinase